MMRMSCVWLAMLDDLDDDEKVMEKVRGLEKVRVRVTQGSGLDAPS